MDRGQLIDCYFEARNDRDVAGILALLHPQASFCNTFWGETSSGNDLKKYVEAGFQTNSRWYRADGPYIPTPDGMIVRYLAFEAHDPAGIEPVFNGAGIFTIADGLILALTDHYCDPDESNLLAVAKLAEKHHDRSNIAPLGLSARISSEIKRRLTELAKDSDDFLESDVSVTKLADRLNCSVMHLFYVLEKDMATTFVDFVNEARARHACRLMIDEAANDVRFDEIARKSGFEDITQFRDAFVTTFGMSADEYIDKFSSTVGHPIAT